MRGTLFLVLFLALLSLGDFPLLAGEAVGSVPKIAQGNNIFAVNLYKELAASEGNLFFSPASLHIALAMTFVGAAGDTAVEMAAVLHYLLDGGRLSHDYKAYIEQILDVGVMPDGQPTASLTIANRAWGRTDTRFREKYLKFIEKMFNASLEQVDFSDVQGTCSRINAWASENTQGLIKELVVPAIINVRTALILTNAVYFKGTWQEKFNKALTRPGLFKPSGKEPFEIPMMHVTRNFEYYESDGLQVIQLPYMGKTLKMLVALPAENTSLATTENSLSASLIDSWIRGMQTVEVAVAFPKFKLEGDMEVSVILKKMGMPLAFTEGETGADFKGILAADEKRRLHIAKVIHKAFGKIDEEGTEAAAATAVAMEYDGFSAEMSMPKIFNADRPFLFMIRHSATGAILFLGRCSVPEKVAG